MKSKMKSCMSALLLFLGIAAGHAQVLDGLTITQLTYDSSISQWVLDLGLENNGKVYQEFQCDLALPNGLTYKGARMNSERIPMVENPELGYMMPTHVFRQNVLNNGTLRVLVTTDTATPIKGSTGRLYTVRFQDNGTLDKSKAYDVNLTNIELVYRTAEGKLFPYRQQGIIKDPSLRCFDALCNATTVCGYISPEDLELMNTASFHNANHTSVDLTYCTNVSVGTLLLKNHNVMIYTIKENQVDGNHNVVYNGECQQMSLTDKMPFCPLKNFKVKAATYTMKIGTAGYATVILPFSCAVPSGLEAYQVTSVDDINFSVKGELLHGIEAHQPVLLKGPVGTYVFEGMAQTITETPEVMENGLLEGSYLPVTAETGNYLLQRQAEKVAFYRVAANTTPGVKPFHAWLKKNQSGANLLSIDLNESTGIQHLYTGENGVEEIYNLNGQRLLKSERGVNILKNEDGTTRKVLVKKIKKW